MSDLVPAYSRSVDAHFAKNRKPIPLKEGCPGCAMLLRGRKGAAREGELTTAEQVASGVRRRKPTGIFKRRA